MFDESGLSAVALMIEKMPKVAMEALDQFLIIDMAFRKEHYYLSYLEKEPTVWNKQSAARARDDGKKIKFAKCPTSPLKVINKNYRKRFLRSTGRSKVKKSQSKKTASTL